MLLKELLKEQEKQHKMRSTTYGTTGVIPDSNWHGLSIVVHCDRSVLTSDEMIRRQRRMQCCGNAAHPTLSTTKGGTGGRKGRRKEAKKKKYELSHYLNKKNPANDGIYFTKTQKRRKEKKSCGVHAPGSILSWTKYRRKSRLMQYTSTECTNIKSRGIKRYKGQTRHFLHTVWNNDSHLSAAN